MSSRVDAIDFIGDVFTVADCGKGRECRGSESHFSVSLMLGPFEPHELRSKLEGFEAGCGLELFIDGGDLRRLV